MERVRNYCLTFEDSATENSKQLISSSSHQMIDNKHSFGLESSKSDVNTSGKKKIDDIRMSKVSTEDIDCEGERTPDDKSKSSKYRFECDFQDCGKTYTRLEHL